MVTHVESPVSMWVQIVNEENTTQLMEMTEQLAVVCPAASKVTSPLQPNKVCLAASGPCNT